MESFSGYGHHNGDLFIGLLDEYAKINNFKGLADIDFFDEKWWKNAEFILHNKERINLENKEILNSLVDVKSKAAQNLIEEIITKSAFFIQSNYPLIESYHNNILNA